MQTYDRILRVHDMFITEHDFQRGKSSDQSDNDNDKYNDHDIIGYSTLPQRRKTHAISN